MGSRESTPRDASVNRSSPSPVSALIMNVSSKGNAALSRAESASSLSRPMASILFEDENAWLPDVPQRLQNSQRLLAELAIDRCPVSVHE